jgi:hypothetical protein
MVFKNTQSGAEFVLPLPQDPRFWSPGLDHTLNLQIPIPKTLPFGSYALYLSLQDPAPKLYGKPQYAIRLANKDVWQSSKGYNSLNHTVKVSSFNPNPNSLKEGRIHRNSFEISKRVDAQLMGSVGIDLVLVGNTNIKLDVFDMAGKRIVELANGLRSAGSFQILCNGMNQDGRLMPEGVYFITLRSDGKQQTRRVFLRK